MVCCCDLCDGRFSFFARAGTTGDGGQYDGVKSLSGIFLATAGTGGDTLILL